MDGAGVEDAEELLSEAAVEAPPSPLDVPDAPLDGLLLEPADALEVLDRESVE